MNSPQRGRTAESPRACGRRRGRATGSERLVGCILEQDPLLVSPFESSEWEAWQCRAGRRGPSVSSEGLGGKLGVRSTSVLGGLGSSVEALDSGLGAETALTHADVRFT
nr:unnamed protein product [Digitaria exilis]